MVYHIFNASHDEALANGGCNFTPPAAARRIDTDLAVLPYWYARPGEAVLVPEVALAENFVSSLPVGRGVAFAGDVSGATQVTVEPWGWNKALVRTLVKRGVHRDVMPGDEFLDNLRRLQNRKTSSNLLKSLRGELDEWLPGEASSMLAGTSYFVDDCKCLHGLKPFLSGSCMLKKPWSGSGRGLFKTSDIEAGRTLAWSASVIREQGGVEVQPFLDNAGNCAAEFIVNPDCTAVFTGFSLFSTAGGGAYSGNSVKPGVETDIRRALGRSEVVLSPAVEALCRMLPRVLKGYYGPVGVDMMICRPSQHESQMRLFPCVEMNLRRTMGMVALALGSLLARGSTGDYRIMCGRLPGEMLSRCEALMMSHPLETCGGRIVSGYLPLTPVYAETCFHACLVVDCAAASPHGTA